MSRLTPVISLLCLAIFLFTACGEVVTGTPTSAQIYENDETAKLCLVESGEYEDSVTDEVILPEDAPLEMMIIVDLIGSADRGPLIEESCSVELDDTTLVVNSLIEFDRGTQTGTDSAFLDTRLIFCEAPSLSAGDYDVVHGENSYTLTIPSETSLDCGDQSFQEVSHSF